MAQALSLHPKRLKTRNSIPAATDPWERYRWSIAPYPSYPESSGNSQPSGQNTTKPLDWSGLGRGNHIILEPEEPLPLNIGQFLGRGATGDVHEAKCQGAVVALKRKYSRGRAAHTFGQELDILRKVGDHEHIVKILGSFTQGRVMGILLLPVAVCNLRTFIDDLDPLWTTYLDTGTDRFVPEDELRRRHDAESIQRLKSLQVLEFYENRCCTFFPAYLRLERSIGCIANALAFLHDQKIKHKDLKPSNILLTATNLYLTDFGSSTDFSEMTASATDGDERGTPKYFAPEVASYLPSGRPADMFSLGCIYLEICYAHYGTPLSFLQELKRGEDHSFQANLENLPLWIEPFADAGIIGGLFSELLIELLQLRPESRPLASEVVSRLYRMQKGMRDRGLMDAYFGRCCTTSELWAA